MFKIAASLFIVGAVLLGGASKWNKFLVNIEYRTSQWKRNMTFQILHDLIFIKCIFYILLNIDFF